MFSCMKKCVFVVDINFMKILAKMVSVLLTLGLTSSKEEFRKSHISASVSCIMSVTSFQGHLRNNSYKVLVLYSVSHWPYRDTYLLLLFQHRASYYITRGSTINSKLKTFYNTCSIQFRNKLYND